MGLLCIMFVLDTTPISWGYDFLPTILQCSRVQQFMCICWPLHVCYITIFYRLYMHWNFYVHWDISQLFFLKNCLEDRSPSCRATDTAVLNFWWCLPWFQSQGGWIPCLHNFSPVCSRFLRFTSGVTPANCVVVSMIAKASTHVLANIFTNICGAQTHNEACYRTKLSTINPLQLKLFRWFKFTLKPPYTVAHGNFFSAIWNTSHWHFFVKFGLKTAWDIS